MCIRDRGSPTHKWRDLYLSNTSLHLGTTEVKSVAGGLQIKDADGKVTDVSSSAQQRAYSASVPTGDLRATQSTDAYTETGLGDKDTGPFEEEQRTFYDCLKPNAAITTHDLGSGEGHVGA